MGFKQRKKRGGACDVPQWATEAAKAGDSALEEAALARVVHAFALMGGTGGGAVYSCIVLHELLPGSEIVDGYGILRDRCEGSEVTGCYYTAWVKTASGRDLDPAMAILRALNPEFRSTVSLSETPMGPRVDVTEPSDERGVETNKETLKSYREDPKRWWNNGLSPGGLGRVRNRVRSDKL